jgi:3,4-dihydroxy 2-butanone 4-phosphate synthase/GTP cyclohydrolase II
MLEDVNRLHIELDYGEVVNFNNRYFTLSATEENFEKHNKLLIGSYIALPVNLLKYHGDELKTSEEFLKFPITQKPKKINDFFINRKLSKFIDIEKFTKLDSSEKKIISIFKKLNILPFPIFLKCKPYELKFSFNLKKIKSSAIKSKIVYKDSTNLPLKKNSNVEIIIFDDLTLKNTHYALVFNKNKKKENPTVRVHSSCLTGDLMGSQKCDCGYQLETALDYMSKSKKMSMLIYLNQEGRGLGIHNKIISYNIQEKGWDTYQADNILGFSGDERDYKAAAEILKYFKIRSCNLITNNPEKIDFLRKNKIKVNKTIKIKPGVNKHNKKYLETKKLIGKHLLKL